MPLADLIRASPEGLVVGAAVVAFLIAHLVVRVAHAHLARSCPVPVVCERLRRTALIDTLIGFPPFFGLILFGSLFAAGLGTNADLARAAFGIAFWQWGLGIVAVSAVAVVGGNLYWSLTDPVVSDEEMVATRENSTESGAR